jgi:tRNA (guanine-N7-)-methyltransferase
MALSSEPVSSEPICNRPGKPLNSNSEQKHRPIRSYVIRGGRLTDSQRKAIEQHWADYVLDFSNQQLDLDSLFPAAAPLTVEIGFGMGDSLLAMAAANPQQNFLGIEVHKPGVGKLLHGIAEQGLTNLKVICHDAKEVIEQGLGSASVDRFLVFFPDPWHKKKHHKRRIIQPQFSKLLSDRLKAGGKLHLATDWQAYAEHMLEVLEAEPSLKNANGPGQYWLEPDRPETKFQRRGQRLGHGVWDLLYEKAAS